MIIAGILAAGNGTRFGTKTPKQFILLNNKPILYYSIKTFLSCSYIDKIIITIPVNYKNKAINLLKKFFSASDFRKLIFIEGGVNRTLSLLNLCQYLLSDFQKDFKFNPIIISHDGDRPFVEKDIISDTIIKLGAYNKNKDYSVVTTGLPLINTTYDGVNNIILNRDVSYSIQTPQTFYLQDYISSFYNIYVNSFPKDSHVSLMQENKILLSQTLPDVTSLFLKDNKKIHIIKDSIYNIKITTPFDYKIAKLILNEKNKKY